MEKILKELLDKFPYAIIEFHTDNGSEYINKLVAKLLNKLLIRLTKTRPGNQMTMPWRNQRTEVLSENIWDICTFRETRPNW